MIAVADRIVTVFYLNIAFHLLSETLNGKRPPYMVKFRCRIQTKTKERGLFMDGLRTFTLERNRQIKINFDGGDLSSDAVVMYVVFCIYDIHLICPFPKIL